MRALHEYYVLGLRVRVVWIIRFLGSLVQFGIRVGNFGYFGSIFWLIGLVRFKILDNFGYFNSKFWLIRLDQFEIWLIFLLKNRAKPKTKGFL